MLVSLYLLLNSCTLREKHLIQGAWSVLLDLALPYFPSNILALYGILDKM